MSDEPEAQESLLTVKMAAALMRVSENTPYNWINNGWLESEQREGTTMIAPSKLRPAKVLRQIEVRDHLATHGIHDKADKKDVVSHAIAAAVAAGAAKPLMRSPAPTATSAPEQRFSLEDVEAIVAVHKGTWKSPDAPPSPGAIEGPRAEPARSNRTGVSAVPLGPDEFRLRAGRVAVLEDYIVNHREPMDLPRTFWDTRDCPEFVPAAGVFRYTYGPLGYVEEEIPGVSIGPVPRRIARIRRSKGWLVQGGRPVPAPENKAFALDRSDRLPWPPGKDVPIYESENQRWRQQHMQWDQAWYLRRRELRAMGIDPLGLPSCAPTERRNRQDLIREYHEESWGPSDLPDWFWDTEDCPPFEPPNEVCRFEYGEQGPCPDSPTNEVGTFIRSLGFWAWMSDPCELYDNRADDRFRWVPGRYPEGTLPTGFTRENREWDAAQHAWLEEWRLRGRRRRGE